MDDERRNDGLGSAPVEPDPDKLSEQAVEELETELDETTQTIEDETVARIGAVEADTVTLDAPEEDEEKDEDAIPITPLDGEDEKESSEPELCILCGEKPADKSFGKNYDLCADCRAKLAKSPLHYGAFLLLAFILFVGMCGLRLCAVQLPVLQAVSKADGLLEQNKLSSAMDAYASNTNIGWKTAKRIIKACVSFGAINDVSSVKDLYFYDMRSLEEGEKITWADKVGKSNINAPWNKTVRAECKRADSIVNASNTYYALISDYDEQVYNDTIKPSEIPYDELIKKYEEARKTEKSTAGLAMISRCEYYLADLCEKDAATKLAFMLQAEKDAPDYGWLYLNAIIEAMIDCGRYEEIKPYINKLVDNNADDVYYRGYYNAVLERMQGNYDEAIKLLEPIIADYDNNNFYLAYYEAGITSFLKGDFEAALDYMSSCLNDYENLTTLNFYALLCKKTGDQATYDDISDYLNTYQYSISKTVEGYFKGTVTAEQIINGREAKFE